MQTFSSLLLDAIDLLKLNVDSESVRMSILRGSRGVTRPAILRMLKDVNVKIKRGCNNKLRIYIPSDNKGSTYFCMQELKTILPKVIVQGIPSVNRAVINETDKDGKQSYNLLVEGYGLQDVMVRISILWEIYLLHYVLYLIMCRFYLSIYIYIYTIYIEIFYLIFCVLTLFKYFFIL
jgi:hypothetical protein